MPIRVLFFGTPLFAEQIVTELDRSDHTDLVGLVTTPDKPVGRKQILTPSPVKAYGTTNKIPVYTPENINRAEVIQTIPSLSFDVVVVAAYGSILSADLLKALDYRVVNVHPSLLPQYRGPAPITFSLWNGDAETGVTLIEMDTKMDHGPILAQKSLTISPTETITDLEPRLASLSAKLLLNHLPAYVSGNSELTPQNHNEATFSRFLHKTDGQIDWTQSAESIYNQYRALNQWPGVFTFMNDQKIVLDNLTFERSDSSLSPGEVTPDKDSLRVGTGAGEIQVGSLKPAGKQFMDAATFTNGYSVSQFS